MIRRVLLTAAALMTGTALTAGAAPKDDVTAAAKKLADANNYAWTSTTENQGGGGGGGGGGRGFGGGPVTGKTEKGGFTHITITRGDNTFETVRKGEQGAVKTQDGWQSFEELRQAAQDGGGGRGRGFGGMAGRNARLPAEEVQTLAMGAKELSVQGDAIQGDLNEETIRQFLAFGGGGGRRGGQGGQGDNARPAPTNAKGTVKFWVKDGNLAKYQYQVQGTIQGRQGDEVNINRTTTVEIKDVGSTKVEVPEEAKKKIGG